ncbi:uncharacterized protein LOC143352892 [Halictus rubicundus]|uniref:uncharacterized protein LOC143352892 n=1 Tax=Halictus rubicundus TaxID=77578 RepID=UPI0040358A39
MNLPQTSPRGTMERQRSPREIFTNEMVPDLKTEFEQRVRQDREMSDESQYLLNVGRSSRNSLVTDELYRTPSNGGRRPKNSLVPGIGASSEMLYGSRHSVHDASLSPRNSLLPDVAYNRSPRKSISHLNGSRTSLMSENGNLALKSPRHSLVPNSPRCPRGSTMELVDRSPQRSPRESVVSETFHQPRNVNRSPRGSIGMNDGSRELIGVGDNEAKTVTYNVEPPIERVQRGSLGGLPDEKNRPNLMAQDPRRASADQGFSPRRNSSPYREKTKQKIEKPDANAHQTTMTHGYGLSSFEESRRASSSVSQFSGDESRRLFNNGVKVPDVEADTNNYKGITYGSVVFQLKDANVEAKNTIDFAYRALKVVFKTRIATAFLLLLSLLPCLMLIVGWEYSGQCRAKDEIPTYMIIAGAFGALFMFLVTYSQIRSRRLELLTVHPPTSEISFVTVVVAVLSGFLILWFIMGNIWILEIMWPSFDDKRYEPDKYCNYWLYMLSIVHLYVIYITFLIIIVVMLVMAVLRLIGWWLPGR